MEKQEKYVKIWKENLAWILQAIEKGEDKKTLDRISFCEVGNRVSSGYSFRLEIDDTNIPTKKGSAVARDLKDVLDDSENFKRIASHKKIVIKMGKDFTLQVKVESINQ